MIIVVLFFYLVPAVIAACRRHSNAGAILALNLLTGWTLIGWIVALVWSFTDNVRRAGFSGVQPTQVLIYAPPIHPVMTGGAGGRSPAGYLPHDPLERCCRIRQNVYSGLWYIESALNPQYTWTGSEWDQYGVYAQTFAFPEGAQAEAQLRGFQVIA